MRTRPLLPLPLTPLVLLCVATLLAACSQVRPAGSTAPTGDPIDGFELAPLAGDAPLLVTAAWQLADGATGCSLDFGDASAPHFPRSCASGEVQHTFATPGAFEVTLAADRGGETYERVVVVNVTDPTDPTQNHSPSVGGVMATPSEGDAPLPVLVAWEASDPDGDTLSCTVVTGDGTGPHVVADCATNDSFLHTFEEPGSYEVIVTVTDGRGGSVGSSTTVTVTDGAGGVPENQKPVVTGVTVTPPQGAAPLATTVTWEASDPDGDDLVCTVDFGDGSSQAIDPCGGAGALDHTYVTPGHYTVTVTVSDGHGGSVTRSSSVNVVAAPAVLLSTGTSLLTVDSDDGPVLDALVSGLLGSPLGAGLVSWESLAGADVSALDLVAELEDRLGLEGAAAVLGAAVSLDDLAAALQSVLGGVPVVDELDDLRTELLGGLAGTIELGSLIDVSYVPQPELFAVLRATDLNVLDLVLGSLQLYGNLHVDPAGGLAVGLPVGAGLDAVSAISARVSVVEPPRMIIAREGATFSTAAMRVVLDVELVSSETPVAGPVLGLLETVLSAPLLLLAGELDANVSVADLELYIDIAPATGTVTAVDEVAGSVGVTLEPGVTELVLGRLAVADRDAFLAGAPSAGLTFERAAVGAVELVVESILTGDELGRVALYVGASASTMTPAGAPTAVAIDSLPGVAVVDAGPGAVEDLVTDLLDTLDLSLEVGVSSGAIGALLDVLAGLLGGVLDALVGTLEGAIGALPLGEVLTEVVDPALDAFGVGLGEAAVTARQMVTP